MHIKALRRLFGYAHILLGLAVAGQFVASPTYDVATSTDVWDAMSFAMAVGAATALAVSLMRVRQAGRLPDWRATTMLIAAGGTVAHRTRRRPKRGDRTVDSGPRRNDGRGILAHFTAVSCAAVARPPERRPGHRPAAAASRLSRVRRGVARP